MSENVANSRFADYIPYVLICKMIAVVSFNSKYIYLQILTDIFKFTQL